MREVQKCPKSSRSDPSNLRGREIRAAHSISQKAMADVVPSLLASEPRRGRLQHWACHSDRLLLVVAIFVVVGLLCQEFFYFSPQQSAIVPSSMYAANPVSADAESAGATLPVRRKRRHMRLSPPPIPGEAPATLPPPAAPHHSTASAITDFYRDGAIDEGQMTSRQLPMDEARPKRSAGSMVNATWCWSAMIEHAVLPFESWGNLSDYDQTVWCGKWRFRGFE